MYNHNGQRSGVIYNRGPLNDQSDCDNNVEFQPYQGVKYHSKSNAQNCICKLFGNSPEVANNTDVSVLPRINHDLITNSFLFIFTKHVRDAFFNHFFCRCENLKINDTHQKNHLAR